MQKLLNYAAVVINAKQKHPEYKKCEANKKQPYLFATKNFDIS